MVKQNKGRQKMVNKLKNLSKPNKLFLLATLLVVVPNVIALLLLPVIGQSSGTIYDAIEALTISVPGLIISAWLLMSDLKTSRKLICLVYILYFLYVIFGSIAALMLNGVTWGGV